MPLLDYQFFIFFRKFFSFGQFSELEPLRLAQFHLIFQLEHRFASAISDVDVNRTMLVAVKEKPESVFLKNGWHGRGRFNQCAARAANSKFPLCARQLAGDARVVPARGVHSAGERLEQRLDDVMRLVAVKEFQMQVAAGLVGEALEKFARQPEPERTGGDRKSTRL